MFSRIHIANRTIPLLTNRRQGSTISVILLEKVGTVGNAGVITDVKRGYARNFLIPRKLAAYATVENKSKYSSIIQSTKQVGGASN